MIRRLQWIVVRFLLLTVIVPFGASAADHQDPAPSLSRRPAGRDPERNEEGFAQRLREDLAEIIRRPAQLSSRDWNHLGVGLAVVGGTALLDTEIRSRIQDRRTSASDNLANAVRPLGEWGAFAGIGVTWIVGHATHNPRVQRIAEDGFEASIIAAGLITPTLKVLVGRARPIEGLGPGYLKPFSGHYSFPSGEAAEAFAVASVIASHTKSPWLKGSMWGFAGLVALERIELDGHWASDVVAGALIGAEVGMWVVKRGARECEGRVDVVVLPVIAPGTYGFSGSVSW